MVTSNLYFQTLFWDDITIFWDENYVNKLLIGPNQVLFFSVKNHNKFGSKVTSQNIVKKGHEQVYRVLSGLLGNTKYV